MLFIFDRMQFVPPNCSANDRNLKEYLLVLLTILWIICSKLFVELVCIGLSLSMTARNSSGCSRWVISLDISYTGKSAKRDWKVESKLQGRKAGFRCRNYICLYDLYFQPTELCTCQCGYHRYFDTNFFTNSTHLLPSASTDSVQNPQPSWNLQ